jgi:hypothetical protein
MRDWASRSRPRKLARSRRPSRSVSPRTPFTWTGTAPIGEDQALIIADVLGECFGAQMLEAAAAFAVEQEAGKPPQRRLKLVIALRDDAEPSG